MRVFTFLFFGFISLNYAQTNFTRYEGNPVLKYGSGFEQFGVLAPAVIKDGEIWKMWYYGWAGSSEKTEIGFATSVDGFNWTKYEGNPVIALSDSVDWANHRILGPSVIKEEGIYKMWFTGTTNAAGSAKIGYATSIDGINWEIQNNLQPVLEDSEAIGFQSILKQDGNYKMWYTTDPGGALKSIDYATSNDGINWQKYESNPVMLPENSFAEEGIFKPTVLFHNGIYHMWYTRWFNGNSSIAYARSIDGITWMKTKEAVLNPTGITSSWERWSLARSFSMLDNDTLKMWYDGAGLRGSSLSENANSIGYAYDTGFVTGFEDEKEIINKSFALHQNYPNPFNPKTIINYELPIKSNVTLTVYDISGREIKTLVNQSQNAGQHSATFDASGISSGIYFYRLGTSPSTGSGKQIVQSRKMVVLK